MAFLSTPALISPPVTPSRAFCARSGVAQIRARVSLRASAAQESPEEEDTAFVDDACDLFGKNCAKDGSVPEAARRVIPTERGAPKTASLEVTPVMVDYAGKDSVLQEESHETTGK